MEGRRNSFTIVSNSIPPGSGEGIFRSLSRTFSRNTDREEDSISTPDDEEDASDDKDGSVSTMVDEWRLSAQVKEAQLNDPAEGRRLGITWKDLSVKVVPSDARLQENALSQFNIPKLIGESRHKKPLKTILDASSGCVKPGEMLLVLGRPGSGCTTLLKMLANRRKGYVTVRSD